MTGQNYDSLRANWKCMSAIVLVSLCPFQYGIDFGLIGGIQAMIPFMQVFGYKDPKSPVGWNITTEFQQLISSLMTLGAFIASGFAGPIATYLGRKSCLWIACGLCCVADAVMMATTSVAGLYVARLLLGLSNGMLMSFSQLYIQEVSPARWRGLSLAAFQFWTSAGTLIATIVDNYTAPIPSRAAYLIPLGLIYIVPVIIFVGLFFIPESPRWLIEQGKTEKAREGLQWLRPNQDGIDAELLVIEQTIREDEENSGKALLFEMFQGVNRRRTLLAVAAVNTQAASGAMYMIAYGTYFFQMAGIGKPFENSVILTAVGVIAIIINTLVITRWGRRRVFLVTGLCLCGIVQLIMAAVYDVRGASPATGKMIVGLSVVYILGYNGMISSYAWVSGGELPSQRLRSYTFGLAASIGFFGAWLATFTAPYFINPESLNWGPRYGYIWFPSCIIAAIFIFFFLPEVKGRSLEEIDEMFMARLPARKFRKYQCTGQAAIESKLNDAAGGPEADEKDKKGETAQTIEHVFEEQKPGGNVAETAVHIA